MKKTVSGVNLVLNTLQSVANNQDFNADIHDDAIHGESVYSTTMKQVIMLKKLRCEVEDILAEMATSSDKNLTLERALEDKAGAIQSSFAGLHELLKGNITEYNNLSEIESIYL